MSTNQIAFSINASTLTKTLSKVTGIINNNPTTEYLCCVKLTINQGQLSIQATNMDCVIQSYDDTVSNTTDGSICVHAHSLLEIAKKLPKENNIDFSIQQNDENLQYLSIKSGKSKFELATLNAENYPETLVTEKEQRITMENEDLLFLIDKTKTCIYTNETRYNINGMLLNFDKESNKIFGIATDGHRLAYSFVENKGITNSQKVTIPRKIVLELKRILDSENGTVEIDVSNSKVTFNFTNSRLTTKLIDAVFPDYERVVPKDYVHYFSVNTKNFLNAIDRVSSIYSGGVSENGVRLHISPSSLKITSIKDINKSYDEVPLNFTMQNEMQIMCNFTYIKEVLSLINSPDVKILVKDSNLPIIVKDEVDESFFYIITPMKI